MLRCVPILFFFLVIFFKKATKKYLLKCFTVYSVSPLGSCCGLTAKYQQMSLIGAISVKFGPLPSAAAATSLLLISQGKLILG